MGWSNTSGNEGQDAKKPLEVASRNISEVENGAATLKELLKVFRERQSFNAF